MIFFLSERYSQRLWLLLTFYHSIIQKKNDDLSTLLQELQSTDDLLQKASYFSKNALVSGSTVHSLSP